MAAFFIGRDYNARPVLPGAEMTGQQLFMPVINRTNLAKTILVISPGVTWKEVAFARSCTPDTIKTCRKAVANSGKRLVSPSTECFLA
jgi:hypothetical protein